MFDFEYGVLCFWRLLPFPIKYEREMLIEEVVGGSVAATGVGPFLERKSEDLWMQLEQELDFVLVKFCRWIRGSHGRCCRRHRSIFCRRWSRHLRRCHGAKCLTGFCLIGLIKIFSQQSNNEKRKERETVGSTHNIHPSDTLANRDRKMLQSVYLHAT